MKYKFDLTCPGCPEQYDVYDPETKIKVAYVRYRWGHLRVHPYKPDLEVSVNLAGNPTTEQILDINTVIFEKGFGNPLDGVLPSDLREKILEKVDREIQKYYGVLPAEEPKEWYNEY